MADVSDSFFIQNNGRNIAGNGKTVEGANQKAVDTAGIASQVIGTKMQSGTSKNLKKARSKVRKFVVDTDVDSIALAETNFDRRDYGNVYLWAGAFDGRNELWGRNNLYATTIHETFHFSDPYRAGGLRSREGLGLRAAYEAMHRDMDEISGALTRHWGLFR